MTFSKGTKPDFRFKALNFKAPGGILVGISSISGNKPIPGSIIILGTLLIGEIEPFQVVNEHIFSDILNARNVPTIIKTFTRIIPFGSGMGDNFFRVGSTFMVCSGFVVIALDPKVEITFTTDHLVVHGLVLIESFQVGDVPMNITAADGDDEVKEVADTDYQPCGNGVEKIVGARGSNTDTCPEDY
jgi:hypothetical protein